jgi:hypothetical protein
VNSGTGSFVWVCADAELTNSGLRSVKTSMIGKATLFCMVTILGGGDEKAICKDFLCQEICSQLFRVSQMEWVYAVRPLGFEPLTKW